MLYVPDEAANDIKDDKISVRSLQDVKWKKASYSRPEDILKHAIVCCAAQEYACSPVQVSTGNEIVNVIQGEVAVIKPGDGPSALGSDSATTCHIVGIRNPDTGETCLAHLDDWKTANQAVRKMLHLVSGDTRTDQRDAPLDLYIVGGYIGVPSATHLSQALLSTLHASRQVFCVVLACISCVNSRPLVDEDSTKEARPSVHASDKSPREGTLAAHESTNSGGKVQRECAAQMIKMDARDGTEALGKDHGGGWLPRQTSLAIDVASGQAFAVQFEGAGRGPGWEVRYLRLFGGPRQEPVTEVYDARTDSIVVAPFSVQMDRDTVTHLLDLPDRELLAATSTSPEAEDERFIPDIREHFSFLLTNIGPDGTEWSNNVFGGDRGKPLIFSRTNGVVSR